MVSRGSITEALLKDKKLLAEVTKAQQEIETEEQVIDEPKLDEAADPNKATEAKKDGKLIVAEEIETGHVSWDARACFSPLCWSVALTRGRSSESLPAQPGRRRLLDRFLDRYVQFRLSFFVRATNPSSYTAQHLVGLTDLLPRILGIAI